MLNDTLKAQLQAHLQRLIWPIELVASLDDSQGSSQMRELMSVLAQLSPLITVREDGLDSRRPSFSIARQGGEARLLHVLGRIGPLSLTALLATLVLLFGFQGEALLQQPLVIALLAVLFFGRTICSWIIDYLWWGEMGQVPTWIRMTSYRYVPGLVAWVVVFAVLWIAHARGLSGYKRCLGGFLS